MIETLNIGLSGAVDVKVVGIGGSDDCGPWGELMEGAVKLVGLDHHIGTCLREEVVGAVVLADTAEEGVASHMALMEQMGGHRGGGGLAVGTGHTKGLEGATQSAEHLSTLMQLIAAVLIETQLAMITGDGGGIDYERGGLVLEAGGDKVNIVLIMQAGPFGLQTMG